MEKKLKIQTPVVPNFVMVEIGDKKSKMDVANLDERELKEIAKEWTATFIKNAHERAGLQTKIPQAKP